MALYGYACPECGPIEASFPMGSAPDGVECPSCGGVARRRFTAPNFSQVNTKAFKLIDATEKTAHEPQVVTGSIPSSGRRRVTPVTTNPLHQKLPRP